MEENEIQYGKITAAGETGRRGREQEMKENGVIQEYTGSLSRQIRWASTMSLSSMPR